MYSVENITIAGSGNVAWHLGIALNNAGVRVTHIFSRNQKSGAALADQFGATYIHQAEDIPPKQLLMLCVPDDQVLKLSQQLKDHPAIAYTSGNVDLSDLTGGMNAGVFYPLQTFTKGIPLDFGSIPLLIEATNAPFERELMQLGSRISSRVLRTTSHERRHIHLVAVWVNNFTNHILFQAGALADAYKIDRTLFDPLLDETLHKVKQLGPYEAQTGPARRGDTGTIQHHLNALHGLQEELYALLSKSIQATYKSHIGKKDD